MAHRDLGSKNPDMDQVISPEGPPRYFVRLNLDERIQHFIFVISFLILALTGLINRLPGWSYLYLGSAKETVFLIRSLLHRTFAITLMLVCVYHVYYLIFKPAGRRWLKDMMPKPKDIADFYHNMLYLIGLRANPPVFDRFSYKHKMEYGALIAGMTLMSASGIVLWSEFFWDKFIVDIAALVHGMEAVLACLALMIWHMYEVHLRPHKFPIDNLWLTGVIDETEMKEEFPLHYDKIMKDPNLQKIYMREGP